MQRAASFILRKSLFLTGLTLLLATAGHAVTTLGTYSFTGGLSVTSQVDGVDFGPLTATGATLNSDGSSSGWPTSSSFDPSYYLSISLRPEAGHQLSLTQVSGLFSGQQSIAADLFVDNALQEHLGPSRFIRGDPEITFNFSDLEGIEASSLVEFRIYSWRGGMLNVDELTVFGEVTAVPEPASYAVLAGAIALFGAMWCRRDRKFP